MNFQSFFSAEEEKQHFLLDETFSSQSLGLRISKKKSEIQLLS